VRSRVWQATCSPFRNPLDAHERRAIRFATSKAGSAVGRALMRSARVQPPPVDWSFVHEEPWFDNQVATIAVDGRRARFTLEKTMPDDGSLRLEDVFSHDLG
jgi:hypothetical protein